jgi:flagellin-like protein
MRGISPLIATIMLIAFVLVVSGIFYGWVSQFTYSEREEFQKCSKAQILTQRAYYSEDAESINIVVQNTGSVPLKGFTALVSTERSVSADNSFSAKEVVPGGIGLFPVKYESGIRTLVVQSVECRNAQDMISVYDVEGL